MTNLFDTIWKGYKSFLYTLSILFLILSVILNPEIISFILNKTQQFSNTTLYFIHVFRLFLFFIGLVLFCTTHIINRKASRKIKEGVMITTTTTLTLLLITLLIETTIRATFPQTTLTTITSINPKIYTNSQPISWALKPNTTDKHCTGEFCVSYTINSHGLRGKEYLLKKNKDTKRILILGDSFTFGFGVEENETYTHLLEQRLNNKTQKFEVWNAGVSGYGPDAYYLFLKENIAKIKPDIVIIGFYAGNDLYDICYTKNDIDEQGLPITAKSRIFEVKNNQLILKNSRNNPYKSTIPTYVNIILSRWLHSYVILKTKMFQTTSASEEHTPFLLKDPPNSTEFYWRKTTDLLLAMKNLSITNNADFKIIIIPTRGQVKDKEWERIEYTFKKYNPSRNLIQKKLLDWCTINSLICADLLPRFLSTQNQLYYTLTDQHLNPQGHALVAEIITKELHLEKNKK